VFSPSGATLDQWTESVAVAVGWCRRHGVEYFPVGSASNAVLGDVDGVLMVIGPAGPRPPVEFAGTLVAADTGIPFAELARTCSVQCLSGIEFGLGMPGTLGGAIATNAYSEIVDVEATRDAGSAVPNRLLLLDGLYPRTVTRQSMARVVDEVTIVNNQGDVQALPAAELGYLEPHWSAFLSGELGAAVAVSARLQLLSRSAADVERFIATYATTRKVDEQPTGQAIGSVFVNSGYPRGEGADALTDHEAWFTDADELIVHAFADQVQRHEPLREGGISCNLACPCFFANDGTGTLDDVLRLLERIHAQVLAASGVSLVSGLRFIPESLAPAWARKPPQEYRQWRYRLYQRMGTDAIREDPTLALQYIEKALDFSPGAPVALFNRALAFACMDKWREAGQALAEVRPADGALAAGKALLGAQAAHSLGDYEEAVTQYEAFLASEFFAVSRVNAALADAVRALADAAHRHQPLTLDTAHPFHPSKIDLSD